MIFLPWLSAVLLVQAVHSYILLTATLDDVHEIAKQIFHSPVGDQLNHIMRRASTLFNHQLPSPDDTHVYRTNLQNSDSSSEPFEDNQTQIRKATSQHSDDHRRSQSNETNIVRSSMEHNPRQNRSSQELNHHNAENLNTVEQKGSNEDSSPSQVPQTHEEEVDGNDRGSQDGVADQTDEVPNEVPNLDTSGQFNEVQGERGKLSRTDEVIALGKNASFYLNSIKKIIENV